MNYVQFQQALAEEVRSQDKNAVVRLRSIRKNNGVLRDAMEICVDENKLTPSIYLDRFYKEYEKGVPMTQLASLVLEKSSEYARTVSVPYRFFRDYKDVRSRIFCRLINREKNLQLLDEIPHIPYLDLEIVFYYQVEEQILPDSSIQIRNEHLERWGVQEEELRKDAAENTIKLQKPLFQTLSSALMEMHVDVGTGDLENPLYLLTNQDKCFGAVCICYPGKTREIAEQIGGDYYVLPSSIHECLILGASEDYNAKELSELVRGINRTQLEEQEILADHVYYYDTQKHALMIPR